MGNSLFGKKLKVINVGLESFYKDLKSTGTEVVDVEFTPPRIITDEELKSAIDILKENIDKIEKANKKALEIILKGEPYLIDIGIAKEVIPGMHDRMILHAGPPVEWERMCGPMRGAVMGALVYEGIAKDIREAEEIAASGEIEFSPCHHHSAVGPMAGVVAPSMPVFIVENKEAGNKAYCTLNEGLGKVLRYGAYDEEVIKRLKWMETELAPVLKETLKLIGPIDLKNIIAQALHMGDELHNRNKAATSLFIRQIAPFVSKAAKNSEVVERVLKFIDSNDHFFLNLSMPAAKSILDPARGIKYSSVVVVMARNGTDFGIRLSGTGDEWFTAKAEVPDALFFPGYTKEDANPDIGDSSITETAGYGGFAIASAPAIVQFVGGTASKALAYTKEMYKITVGENNVFTIPYLDFRGTPTGIDALKVVETGILPVIDTGVAHKKPGIGQVGAGVLRAPMPAFEKAVKALAKSLKA